MILTTIMAAAFNAAGIYLAWQRCAKSGEFDTEFFLAILAFGLTYFL
ncbi:hypothetical protein SAMN02744133_10821 [Thalassospira xiamenensis M-5 = DSM 17429]|nr:hypothetical protein SAMN02744133_10821 [Thalassospira xiamenensis M-5 = DSM 17429]